MNSILKRMSVCWKAYRLLRAGPCEDYRQFLLQQISRDSIGVELGVQKGGFSAEILEEARPRKQVPSARTTACLLVLVGLAACDHIPTGPGAGGYEGKYLRYTAAFSNTLIESGRDVHGAVATPMWVGVIDASDLSVPDADVPALEGTREEDRAVGGSNLYHDAMTLRTFYALSEETNDRAYQDAADAYIQSYLQRATSPASGLIAWGEHLYYDVFSDEVVLESKWHELLESTPPWDLLHRVDPGATERAISGLRYHFLADDPLSLYDRHAQWASGTFQNGSPRSWIKHAALFAYSFMFLHRETADERWSEWGNGTASLFWTRRHEETGLVHNLIQDTVFPQRAGPGMVLLAYWVLKASQQDGGGQSLRHQALTYLSAFNDYFYSAETGGFHQWVLVDGSDKSPSNVSPWGLSYADVGLLRVGRIGAYAAATEGNPSSRLLAERVGEIVRATGRVDQVTPLQYGLAVHLMLDLHQLTGRTGYLLDAREFADEAIELLWVGGEERGLFVRTSGDRFYEAKEGAGELVSALLRLHLQITGADDAARLRQWSF